jgi:hydrogenase expression/formation protein HypC
MCIAVPGKLIEIDGRHGRVDVSGNILPVELGVVQANVGDYVLIHAGCAISVLQKEDAEELQDLFKSLEEMQHE